MNAGLIKFKLPVPIYMLSFKNKRQIFANSIQIRNRKDKILPDQLVTMMNTSISSSDLRELSRSEFVCS